jgi:hypothetical protein
MQGIITTKTGRYLFRDDHAHGDMVWAWNINDGDRAMTHKWGKLPAGVADLSISSRRESEHHDEHNQ